MSIAAGNSALASDFINNGEADASPVNDNGRVPKLEDVMDEDAKLHPRWIKGGSMKSLTAGENITKDDAIMLITADSKLVVGCGYSGENGFPERIQATNDYYAQSFTTPSDGISIITARLNLYKQGSPTGNLTVALRAASSDLPTGANLATDTINVATIPTNDPQVYEFSFTYAHTAGNQYAIVLDPSALTNINTSDEVFIEMSDAGIANGVASSSSDGSSWSSLGTDMMFDVDIKYGNAGEVYLSNNEVVPSPLYGIAKETFTAGNDGYCQFSDICEDLSGLTVGVPYFISDTNGDITTNEDEGVYIGHALSSTSLSMYSRPYYGAAQDYSGNVSLINNVPDDENVNGFLMKQNGILYVSYDDNSAGQSLNIVQGLNSLLNQGTDITLEFNGILTNQWLQLTIPVNAGSYIALCASGNSSIVQDVRFMPIG